MLKIITAIVFFGLAFVVIVGPTAISCATKNKRKIGVVQCYNMRKHDNIGKGIGYVRAEDLSLAMLYNYHLHDSGIKTLKKGQIISYNEKHKGKPKDRFTPEAINIKILEDE